MFDRVLLLMSPHIMVGIMSHVMVSVGTHYESLILEQMLLAVIPKALAMIPLTRSLFYTA